MIEWDRNCMRSRRLAACSLLVLLALGCGESANTAVERRRKQYNEPTPNFVKFSGKVTVDKQPPEVAPDHNLLVVLFDPKAQYTPGKPPRFTSCQPDGTFTFGEGVAPGEYVVLFAQLQRGRPGIWRGPDALKNLYNDPDKNTTREGFQLHLSPTSKTTQDFNLEIAGKEPVTTPGPAAFVHVGRPAQ